MNDTESPTRAGDATEPPQSWFREATSALQSLLAHQRGPEDSGRAGPNPVWRNERRQHALLLGEPGSPRHRDQATGRALTVGPAQGLEEQVSLHADSRHGESWTLRLRHVRGPRQP